MAATGFNPGHTTPYPQLDPNYQTSGAPFSYTPPSHHGSPTHHHSAPAYHHSPASPYSVRTAVPSSPEGAGGGYSPSKLPSLSSHHLQPQRLDFGQGPTETQSSGTVAAAYMIYGSHGKMGGGTISVARQIDLTKSIVDLKTPDHIHSSYTGYGPVTTHTYGQGLGTALAHNIYVRTLKMTDARPFYNPPHFNDGQYIEGSKGAIEELSEALSTNTTLTEIDLNSHGRFRLSDHEITVLMTALRTNQTVTSVDVSAPPSQLGQVEHAADVSAKAESIGNMLRENKSVERLLIANQGFNEKALKMIAREMAGNTTLKTLDISEEVLNGVRSDTYPITLTNLIGKMGPAVDTLMLSRQQVARLGFEGILKALALRPNIVNLSPSPGQSWLPREESMCFMDPATKDAIHLTLLQLQAFENPASDDMAGSISAAGSISFVSLRDLLLERMKGYHLIYRAVCENIVLKVLSPHERALFYNKVWELYGKPMGNMKFGEEHAFKSWFVFFRAVEESKLHHRFPFLF